MISCDCTPTNPGDSEVSISPEMFTSKHQTVMVDVWRLWDKSLRRFRAGCQIFESSVHIYFHICSHNLLDYIREQDNLADARTSEHVALVILNHMNFWTCWTKCPDTIEVLQSATASAEDGCFKSPSSVSWEAASCLTAHKEDTGLHFYIHFQTYLVKSTLFLAVSLCPYLGYKMF